MLTVNPSFESSGEYSWTPTSSSLTRVWFVEGSELECENGQYLATLADGIPGYGDGIEVAGRTLKAHDITGSRHGPRSCTVTVNYLWELPQHETEQYSALERARMSHLDRPFAEHMTITGDQEPVYASEDGTTLITSGSPPTRLAPKAEWTFKAICRPKVAFWEHIGKYNKDLYPPTEYFSPKRPHRFHPEKLMYLGANTSPVRSDKVAGLEWAWEYDFRFVFSPTGWKDFHFEIEREVDGPLPADKIPSRAITSPGKTRWWGYKDPKTGKWEEVDNLSGKFKVVLRTFFKESPIGPSIRIGEGIDFDSEFGLDWGDD